MKIIHVLNTGKFSGAENVAITIINNMPPDYDCLYVCLNGPIEKILFDLGIKYIALNKLSIVSLRKIIKEFNPDLIHAHDFNASVISTLVSWKIPVISHIHQNSPLLSKYCLKSIIYRLSLLKIKKVLCVSQSIIDECIYTNCLKKKSIVVGNPISLINIKNKVHNYNKLYDIIYVGRFSKEKDPLKFVEIISMIQNIKTNIKAIMVGDGDLMNDVKNSIISKGLNKNIAIVGFQRNPYQYMANARYLFLTSKWEGFGLSIVEALSLGLPCVVSNVGGAPSIITKNSGFVANTNDDYVKFYFNVENNNLYDMYSENAISRANDFDNIDKFISILLDIYTQYYKFS